MAVSLIKGQGVSLKKNIYDLTQVTIGLGWDVAESFKTVEQKVEKKKSGLAGILGGTEITTQMIQIREEYDLDVIAFLCRHDGKVNVKKDVDGKKILIDGDIIFYNHESHYSGHVYSTGDNRTGEGEGDDEQIIVKLNSLSDQYQKIIFIVQIYNGIENKQTFGQVQQAYIRAVDNQGTEMARYDLSGGPGFEDCRSMLFAELIREAEGWKFNAVGKPSTSDSFVHWLNIYS